MARPRKSADDALSEPFSLRMSVATRETLAIKARACGVTDAEFLRRYIEGTPNVPRPNSGSADPAMIAAINNYAVALSRIGNNVNQLAAATHMGRDFVKYWREINDELSKDREAARQALNDALEGYGS